MNEAEWELVWEAVRALRRDHPKVFIQFQETTLASLMIDELADFDSAPSLEDLAEHLRKIAESEGPWLVSTPLSNIVIPEPATQLAEDVVLWRAILGTEWMAERFSDPPDDSEFTVHGFLDDRLPRVTRWLRPSSRQDPPLDTGVGAQLLTVEEGTGVLALARARAKAQYALAVWPILHPPTDWKLLPDLAIWVQQPSIQLGQRFKPREHDAWIPREQVQGNSIRFWAEYEAPPTDLLRPRRTIRSSGATCSSKKSTLTPRATVASAFDTARRRTVGRDQDLLAAAPVHSGSHSLECRLRDRLSL